MRDSHDRRWPRRLPPVAIQLPQPDVSANRDAPQPCRGSASSSTLRAVSHRLRSHLNMLLPASASSDYRMSAPSNRRSAWANCLMNFDCGGANSAAHDPMTSETCVPFAKA